MKKQHEKVNIPENRKGENEEDSLPGYPEYPESDDIYAQFREEEEIDPEDPSKTKDPVSDNTSRRKSVDDLHGGEDLDIPGSELDDQQEDIGSEDEENNYYSLGGDNHLDLEEN
jgi:hypothetical protein